MLNDLRYAARVLLQAKGWTLVVVISLALGIGANTAIFSALNGLLLRRVPVSDPDSLVRLRWAGRNQMATSTSDYGSTRQDPATGTNMRTTFSYPMYQQFVKDNQTMADLFACAPAGRVNVVVNGQAELATSFVSTGNYYRVLGVNASLGRVIIPEDDRPDAPPVAVISDKYWRVRFGSDPAVIGKVVSANNVSVTIVGVLPAAFTGVQQPIAEAPDISFPLALDPQLTGPPPGGGPPRLNQPTWWWLQVMGRLEPGATAAQVAGNLGGVFQGTARAGLDSYLAGLNDSQRSLASNQNRTAVPQFHVESGSRGIYDVNQTELRAANILTGIVVLVLLIVCANVANLLLSRATARQKEISVRLSMGATRRRLIGQLLVESLVLAAIGGAAGIAVGYWGKQLLPSTSAQAAPLDWRVLAFVTLITALTGVLFGIAPALRATSGDVSGVLKETSRSVVASRSLLSKALLVVQVAISVVLLIGAGLFLRTLENLRRVDVGFDPQNLVLFRVNPQLNRYDEQRSNLLYQEMIDRLGTIGGVRGVALSNPALLSGSVNSTSIFIQGRTYTPGQQQDGINRLVVSPNFFQMMGMPLLLGRGFTDAENDAKAPKVVVINDAAARKYFPNQNPIGQRFGTSMETSTQMEIVGVLRDAKYDSVRDQAPPTMYVPHLQTRTLAPVFAVRTSGDPLSAVGSIRETVRQIDPNVPVTDVFTQMEQVERRFLQEKTFAQAYTLFGVLSLVLAAVGLFGVMSYAVARRTSEIGIRIALGAQRAQVLGATMRESLVLVVGGLAIGLAIAIGASRFVASLLFGVAAQDATTIAVAMLMMALVAAFAAYLPARRASRVDPMVALRYE
jgi:predicted permease